MDDEEREAGLAGLSTAIEEMEGLARRVDALRRRITLTRREVAETPELVWNAFIALVTKLPYEEMTAIQQVASLAFLYDAEVQNGGHHQFFVNTAEGPERDFAGALDQLSLSEHAALLRRAQATWRSHPRERPNTIEEFCDDALEGEFYDFDESYGEFSVTVQGRLELLLEQSRDEFFLIDEPHPDP